MVRLLFLDIALFNVPHNREGRQAIRYLHLHIDAFNIHALEGYRVDTCDHVPSIAQRPTLGKGR